MEKWYELTKKWMGNEPGKQVQMSEEDGKQLVEAGFAKEVPVSVDAEIVASATAAMSESLGKSLAAVVESALSEVTKTIKRPEITVSKDEADKTKCFTDFLLCVGRAKNADAFAHERLQKVYGTQKAALAENSGTTGGYLVPHEYIARLLEVAVENAIVRPRAEILPMASRSLSIPMLDQTTVYGTGITPFLGGVVAKWTGEASTRNETEPQFKQLEMVAHELAGLSKVSRTLAQDSAIALDPLITGLFGRAIGWYEDYAFLQGDGVAKPLGVLNAPATISVSRTTGNKFQLADAANMISKLIPSSLNGAVWVMSQSVMPQLIQLADGSGRVVYLPNPAATGAEGGAATHKIPMMLFGLPVIFTEKLPVLGSAGDVILADFSTYLIGDRRSIEIESSDHFAFSTNQTTWRFVHRVDGQPWMDNYFTYQDGSTTVSAFVKLV